MKFLRIFNSKNIRVAAMGSLGVKFLSALFALLNAVLLTNLLTIKEFGVYVLAFTTITVISIPVSLGLPELITRYISKYDVSNNLMAMKGLLIRSNQFVVFTSVIALLVAYITYILWWKNYNEMVIHTFWYGFALLPILAFGALRAAALRGLKYILLGQMPDTFLRNFFFTIPLASCYFFKFELSPQTAMLYHVIAGTLAFLMGYWFLYIKLLKRLKKVKPVFFGKLWVKEAFPFSIVSGVQVIKSKLLVYVLAIFGGVEAVAVFDVALRAATLISFTIDALNNAISPYISSAFELNQKATLQRIVKKTARIIFICCIPVALVFVVGGKPIIQLLFGSEYDDSYVPLLILCVGHIINALVGPIAPVINMTGNQKYLSKNQTQMMVISAILSFPLVYYYGYIGAALVSSFVFILQNVILVLFIKRKLKINTTVF